MRANKVKSLSPNHRSVIALHSPSAAGFLCNPDCVAEREGFPACEYADCILCCWEGHSTLCTTARGWQRKNDIRHSAVKPLDLRSGPSWTNRTNEGSRRPIKWGSSVSCLLKIASASLGREAHLPRLAFFLTPRQMV